MNIELEYQKVLAEIDNMIAGHNSLDLSEDTLFEEFKRLVEEADKHDAQLQPIKNAATITIELEKLEYLQLVIRARRSGLSVNTYINDALKSAIETYEHETDNRLPQRHS